MAIWIQYAESQVHALPLPKSNTPENLLHTRLLSLTEGDQSVLGHHAGGLKGAVGDFCHTELLVVGLLGGDDWGVGGQHEVDAGVGHQVGLELSHIHIQGTVKPEGGGQGGDDLSDEPVRNMKNSSARCKGKLDSDKDSP